jgi:fucose 4-O-acetylase-like acetyltransferase
MQRESYFDNFKGLLILLVVIGHFTGAFIYKNHFMDFLVITIYSFHMPAFVFISAYFSKRNSFLKLVKTLLIPYFIFQSIYFIFLYVTGRDSHFSLLQPYFTLWFMLSLFCWRLIIDKIIKIKGIVPISYILAILVGYVAVIGAVGALGRTITYLPFFILGYTFNKEKFVKFANGKAVKISSFIILAFLLIFLYFGCDYVNFNVLIMKYSYEKSNLLQWGWVYRTLIYIVSTFLIYLIAVIIPRDKHWYTYLGQRTMSIYFLHGIIYKVIQYQTNLYDTVNTNIEMFLILLLAISITFILSLKPFDTLIRKLSSVPIEKLFTFNFFTVN